MQIQISWLLQKPTDLDLHCLLRQGISGLSKSRLRFLNTWVKTVGKQKGGPDHPSHMWSGPLLFKANMKTLIRLHISRCRKWRFLPSAGISKIYFLLALLKISSSIFLHPNILNAPPTLHLTDFQLLLARRKITQHVFHTVSCRRILQSTMSVIIIKDIGIAST